MGRDQLQRQPRSVPPASSPWNPRAWIWFALVCGPGVAGVAVPTNLCACETRTRIPTSIHVRRRSRRSESSICCLVDRYCRRPVEAPPAAVPACCFISRTLAWKPPLSPGHSGRVIPGPSGRPRSSSIVAAVGLSQVRLRSPRTAPGPSPTQPSVLIALCFELFALNLDPSRLTWLEVTSRAQPGRRLHVFRLEGPADGGRESPMAFRKSSPPRSSGRPSCNISAMAPIETLQIRSPAGCSIWPGAELLPGCRRRPDRHDLTRHVGALEPGASSCGDFRRSQSSTPAERKHSDPAGKRSARWPETAALRSQSFG